MASPQAPSLCNGGEMFSALLNADDSKVYEAGQTNGVDPIKGLEAIGQFGKFDFQRDKENNLFFDEYPKASNYAAASHEGGRVFLAGDQDYRRAVCAVEFFKCR